MPAKRQPFRLTKPQQERYLQFLREGNQRGQAADLVFGTDNPMIRMRVREFIDRTPEFEQRVLDAEVEAGEVLVKKLFDKGFSGDTSAIRMYLELKGVAEFPERRGRPRKPEPEPPEGAFDDLGADVVSLNQRRR